MVIPEGLKGFLDKDSKLKSWPLRKHRDKQLLALKFLAAAEYNDALVNIPFMNEQAGDTTTALKRYRQLLKDHPTHPDSAWLRKRIEKFSAPVKENNNWRIAPLCPPQQGAQCGHKPGFPRTAFCNLLQP